MIPLAILCFSSIQVTLLVTKKIEPRNQLLLVKYITLLVHTPLAVLHCNRRHSRPFKESSEYALPNRGSQVCVDTTFVSSNGNDNPKTQFLPGLRTWSIFILSLSLSSACFTSWSSSFLFLRV